MPKPSDRDPPPLKGRGFPARLGFALGGLTAAFRRERSLRTHAAGILVVVAVLAVTRPPALWWAAGALAIGLVVVAELLNTALEILADHLHPDLHPAIGAAKDVAAGAVLVASLTAVAVATAFLLR